jgi:hypothetical protein
MHERSLEHSCLPRVNKESVPRRADQQQKHEHLYNEHTRVIAFEQNVTM